MLLKQETLDSIISYCRVQRYKLESDPQNINIIYVEGMNLDGSLNDDAPNHFNDLRIVLGGLVELLGVWQATTEPGRKYTYSPMNPKGAARIQFGQYQAWQVGTHGNSQPHEALVQTGGPVIVCRDLNKDFIRVGDRTEKGFFGINQHWGYDYPEDNIGFASAGCLVGRSREGHQQFMRLIKQDKRYQANKKHIFTTTVIPGDKLG